MNLAEVLQRALGCVGKGARYALGKGGMHAAAPAPFSQEMECDCSGFVAWCLGVSRHTDHPWYQRFNGGWLETTAIVRDAATPFGMFDLVPWVDAKLGHLLVYGDRDGSQGHVGVVSGVDSNGPNRVVHCSRGNFKAGGDAVAETGIGVFHLHGAIVVRCALVDQA